MAYTIEDATFLNKIKNQIRGITQTLDTSHEKYQDTIESSQVKSEINTLLCELKYHGLLPENVTFSENKE